MTLACLKQIVNTKKIPVMGMAGIKNLLMQEALENSLHQEI